MYGFAHYQWMPFNSGFTPGLLGFALIAGLWDLVWKGLGLWRAAQLKQNGWFVAMLLINTLGILPILYLYVFSKPTDTPASK